ncbi:MAG TPA: hypothetical protein VGK73_06730 [Polyangiaceae bacterium]
MSRPDDRDTDLGRIDSAIGLVEEVLSEALPAEGQPNVMALARETRLKAVDRLVALLERRARLLGLDAPAAKLGDQPPGESVLDRMTREIAEQSARPKS